MKLRDMYGRYIAGVGPILNVQIPNEIMIIRDRDPKSIALEQSVQNKMQDVLSSVTPKEKKLPQPANKIRIVSYEEAIKELANTLKPTDDKS